jgi:hypothetical protein
MVTYDDNVKDYNIVFATFVSSERSKKSALLLIESIRAFAGEFSNTPIWCLMPNDKNILSKRIDERLKVLNVKIIPFEVNSVGDFPFANLVEAVAFAESLAEDQCEFLAWVNSNSMILREPKEFLLTEGIKFGYRSVHHTLIGSPIDEPIDEFWSLIYDLCQVPDNAVFPMKTHVDNIMIRPYFNAGCHVSSPRSGLLKLWRDKFLEVYQKDSIRQFYELDNRYKVFMHQAVLSGVVLSKLTREEIFEFSDRYNYPIHLFNEDVTGNRPLNLDDMITIRHEGFFDDLTWKKTIPFGDSIKDWIIKKLSYLE